MSYPTPYSQGGSTDTPLNIQGGSRRPPEGEQEAPRGGATTPPKSLKRLKSAQPLRPGGRAASLREHERLVRFIVEWAQFAAEGIDEYRR